MKKILVLFSIGLLLFALSGCENASYITTSDELSSGVVSDETFIPPIEGSNESSYGAIGALNNNTFTIEEMLVYAIQDEYIARSEYEYILANFDVTRPFSNIIKAEETHIALLLPLFEEFDLSVPLDTSSDHLIIIDDLVSTFETGVVAEEYNIAMYNLFLDQEDLPVSIIDTFTKLRDASISHLGAFQKQLD
jgi:hypothetical protein